MKWHTSNNAENIHNAQRPPPPPTHLKLYEKQMIHSKIGSVNLTLKVLFLPLLKIIYGPNLYRVKVTLFIVLNLRC